MFRSLLLVLSCLFACDKADPPPAEPVTPSHAELYKLGQLRALAHVRSGAYIVSIRPDGSNVHMGEGLFHAGMWLWTASCSAGAGVSRELATRIVEQGGQLVRFDPLGEYAGGREITIDGALQLYAGVMRRIVDCGERDLWEDALSAHYVWLVENDWRLHQNTFGEGSTLAGTFHDLTLALDLVMWQAGLFDEPERERMGEAERQSAVWAAALHVKHDACYRANLAWVPLLTAETAGWATTLAGRSMFCSATRGMDIPTIDHWCGREPISTYIASYVPNEWEYRHMRCGAWESADGKDNLSHGLDLLVALVMLHGWHALQDPA